MNHNDHFVPQFLLRRFCNSDGHLHVFDTWNSRSFVASTRNVASEKRFYDLKIENEVVSFEPVLCEFENSALKALNAIVEQNSAAVLSDDDRLNVACYPAGSRSRSARNLQLRSGFSVHEWKFHGTTFVAGHSDQHGRQRSRFGQCVHRTIVAECEI